MKSFVKIAIPVSIAAAMTMAATPSLAQAQSFIGGAFGNFYYSDGSQARTSRTIAGAAPNMLATFNGGVRCEYRYIYQNGQKVRYEYCN